MIDQNVKLKLGDISKTLGFFSKKKFGYNIGELKKKENLKMAELSTIKFDNLIHQPKVFVKSIHLITEQARKQK